VPLDADGTASFFGIAEGAWRIVLEPFRSPVERGCPPARAGWRVETVCCVRAGVPNRVELDIP
jgi:hypothetical protein